MKNSTEPVRKEASPRSRRTLFIALTVFFSILVVEIGLHIVRFVINVAKPDIPDAKMLLSPYRDQPWAEKYFTEMHQRETEYQAYYGWSLKEYHGEYVNIDSRGLRRTYNPVFTSAPWPDTLFVFGGSTIWGGGARDDYSIPSWLSRLLNEKGHRLHVVNYGTTGYVFTQEVVRLMRALWDGHRPDCVIFYDGTNDVYSAYQSGEAGTLQNLARVRERFRLLSPSGHVATGLKQLISNNCMICRAGRRAVRAVFGADRSRETAAAYSEAELQILANEICASYHKSAELLKFLAEKYDFQYICFWQPVGFLENNLTTEERESDNRLNDKALEGLFRMVNSSLPSDPSAHFYNITDALAGRSGTVYVDFCHISESGNETMARVISDIFESEIFQREQAVDH